MAERKLYPPRGGVAIVPHPSKYQEMIDKGWVTQNKPGTTEVRQAVSKKKETN